MITLSGEQALPSAENHLSAEGMRMSYEKENDGWINNYASERLPKSDVPRGSNIIGSHVLYRPKSDGTAKARIVP